MLAEIDDGDIGSFAGERYRRCSPDSAISASNQRHPAI
jgi:hypothetical protein